MNKPKRSWHQVLASELGGALENRLVSMLLAAVFAVIVVWLILQIT